jgi:hypothetical protein
MFATTICESIVRLPIETRDHESLILRGESTLWSQSKVCERLPWFPLIRRCISLIRYYLSECGTLPSILRSHGRFRELWIYTCRGIRYCTRMRRVCHESQMLHIDSWISDREDRAIWHYPLFPVFLWYTREKWEDIRVT